MSPFTLTIENFEGPIEVLLQLIEKRKMPINDISLASITDEYLQYLQNMETQSLSHQTHFIVVASTLTLIKSKSLLPSLEISDQEESDIEDLKRRLELLKIFQKGAQLIGRHIHRQPQLFYPKERKREISFDPHPSITGSELHRLLQDVLKEVPEPVSTHKEGYIKITVHIEEMMQSLKERITKALCIDFNDFIHSESKGSTEPRERKVYAVVGFLAILELVKNGICNVEQKSNFENIEMKQV